MLTAAYSSYDTKHDILYVSFGPPTPAEGELVAPHILLRYSLTNDKLVGFTVFGYSHHTAADIQRYLPIGVDLTEIARTARR
jgi:uncharacterized protein YuzE